MSEIIRLSLRDTCEDAIAFLATANPHNVPTQDDPPAAAPRRVATLTTSLTRLNSSLARANRMLDSLKRDYNEWLELRKRMTGPERTADNREMVPFLEATPFIQTQRRLQTYIDGLTANAIEIDEEIRAHRPGTGPAPPPPPNQPVPQPHATIPLHLPKITITPFNGKIEDFPSFWSQFRVIHDIDNAALAPALKLTYLRSYLIGDALRVIEGLPLTDGSYAIAVDLLRNQFGQPEDIKRSLYAKIRKIPRLESAAGRALANPLRALVDEIEKICHQLRQQNEDLDALHIQLEIESKFPPHIIKEIYREKELVTEAREAWSTDRLRSKLRQILRREEEVNRLYEQTKPPASKPVHVPIIKRDSTENKGPAQTLTFAASALKDEKPTPKPRLPCLFCDESNHFSSYCRRFATYESRIKRLKEQKRCFRCFDNTHMASNCADGKLCSLCTGEHHRALCPRNWPRADSYPHSSHVKAVNVITTEEEIDAQQNSAWVNFVSPLLERNTMVGTTLSGAERNVSAEETCSVKGEINAMDPPHSAFNVMGVGSLPVLLTCAMVEVFNSHQPHCRQTVLALLDSGSSQTFVLSGVSADLDLSPICYEALKFGVFNQPTPLHTNAYVFPLGIKLLNSTELILRTHALDFLTHEIPFDVIHPSELNRVRKGMRIPQCCWGKPELLIGNDYLNKFALYVERELPSGVCLIQSKLGPLLGGGGAPTLDQRHVLSAISLPNNETLNTLVQRHFSLESIGISDSPDKVDNEEILREFNENLKFDGSRYEIRLPWKSDNPQIMSNFMLCKGRLKSILASLKNQPSILEKYAKNFREQLELGIIESVENSLESFTPLHYLPHLPVIRADKPDKLRVVFDASAKTPAKICLNDLLYQGPLILADLIGMLLRFRIPKFVVLCDIERAFLNIAIRNADRDALRFLWVRDAAGTLNDANIITYRFRRLPFGLTSSPFLLSATIKHHLERKGTPLAREIARNVYVDNILLSAETLKEAQEKASAVKEIFADASMRLREFSSNNAEALALLDDDEKEHKSDVKFLGVMWSAEEDVLFFLLPSPPELPLTKRQMLSFIASIFDPLGLLCPITLMLKVVFQKTWETPQLKWDDAVLEETNEMWINATKGWGEARISVPRRIASSSPLAFELHAFADASSYAFATCIYLRTSYKKGHETALIYSKAKLKPLKQKYTVPRLELLAATIAAKAIVFVKNQLSLSINPLLYLWTDSSAVFHWIKDPLKQDIFTQNRLNVIRGVEGLRVNYVNTAHNPADVASRGGSTADLLRHSMWWRGPPWLTDDEENWPLRADFPTTIINDAIQYEERETTIVLTVAEQPPPLIEIMRFSRWPKLLRSLSFAFRFIRKTLPEHIKAKFPPPSKTNFPDISELRFAQNFLLREAQKRFPPGDKENANLQLYSDPVGLLRSKGRIYKSSLAFYAKEPLFLPPSAYIAKLLIYETHLQMAHSPPSITLSQIRRRFWLPRGRRNVAHAIRQLCMVCRHFSAPHFQWPDFPQLPASRVNPSLPFEFTGVDYFGPLNVKEGEKVWGALYTCLTIRAVHIELVDSLDADAFLDSFKRFIARRGTPRVMYSDNGTQFKLAAKAIDQKYRENWSEIFNATEVLAYFSAKSIHWIFIVENAPWRGGAWERMVKSVKYHLKRCLGRALLTKDKLHTLFTECEAVVNSRPLTYLSEEISNPLPLRPCDLLGTANIGSPPFIEADDVYLPHPTSADKLMKIWQQNNSRLDNFWRAWKSDYLLCLREKNKTINTTNSVSRVPLIGEVVLVEDRLPRSSWRTAIITDLIQSDDKTIRTAVVRYSNGRTTRRAVNQLYPLEYTTGNDDPTPLEKE